MAFSIAIFRHPRAFQMNAAFYDFKNESFFTCIIIHEGFNFASMQLPGLKYPMDCEKSIFYYLQP